MGLYTAGVFFRIRSPFSQTSAAVYVQHSAVTVRSRSLRSRVYARASTRVSRW